MRKLISTRTHGVLDYVSAATMALLPRLLGWSAPTTLLLTALALITVAYSLVTRYELSVAKLLPMRGHLVLDALSGTGLLVAAFLLPVTGTGELVGLVALGAFEIVAALSSKSGTAADAVGVSR